MKVLIKIIFYCAPIVLLMLASNTAHATTNISSATTEHWAWNDIVGWVDFYNTDTVSVSSQQLTGYASSSAGQISLDCATTSAGNLCGTSNYKVNNDGAGNLSGWAWNDAFGWISFCGGQGTTDCPGSISYEVLLTTSSTRSVFSGYGWNDVVGWISFNCSDPNVCATSDYKVVTSWVATSTSSTLDSATFDTGVTNGAQLNSALWQGSQPAGTTVGFQFAASNSSSGPWSFLGSDGTANSYYTVNVNTSQKLSYSDFNNYRYFRYRVKLTSDQTQRLTPIVGKVIVNYSP